LKVLHEKDPRSLDVLRWLAEYNKSIANYKIEILYRTDISLLDPWNADNYFMLGAAYKQIGDSVNLNKMLDKINSFAPNSEIAKKALIELG
jgi:hypothetical protein